MRDKYCLPIQKPTKQSVLEVIGKYRDSYAFFEVWIDYIEDFDLDFLGTLITDLQQKLIVVFRRQKLEPIAMSFVLRKQVLDRLNQSPASADIDISSQTTELEYMAARQLTINTIISHHNYALTPPADELRLIVGSILKHQPVILKIATLCQTEMDAVRLLQLLLELRAQGQRCVILGMGPHGVVTRVFGTLWGNELIFAPGSVQESSAPGQLTRQQLDNIANILEG